MLRTDNKSIHSVLDLIAAPTNHPWRLLGLALISSYSPRLKQAHCTKLPSETFCFVSHHQQNHHPLHCTWPASILWLSNKIILLDLSIYLNLVVRCNLRDCSLSLSPRYFLTFGSKRIYYGARKKHECEDVIWVRPGQQERHENYSMVLAAYALHPQDLIFHQLTLLWSVYRRWHGFQQSQQETHQNHSKVYAFFHRW